MELIVKEFKQLPSIEFNYEELKKEIADKLIKYKGQVYDDLAIVLAKKDRAALNSLKKILTENRIKIKEEILKPYYPFEMQIKDIINMIDKPVLEIDTQVKTYEEKVKTEKRAEIEKYFNSVIGDLSNILTLEKIFNDRWLNVSFSIKNIETEIDEMIQRVNSDLEVIKNLNSEFYTELNNEYLCNFDLAEVLRKKTILEEQKKALEERTVRLKEIEEEKQAVKRTIYSQSTIYTKEPKKPLQTDLSASETQDIAVLDFRVWVTGSQIVLLKQFLKENNIKFGRVPEREE